MIGRCKLLVGLALLGGCGAPVGPPLTVTDVEITEPIPGVNMSAGYLTLRNHSDDTIEITHVTSPQFDSVEMHESIDEDGVSRMERLVSLRVEAGQVVSLKRGGKHLMLMRPAGSNNDVTLNLHAGNMLLLSVSTTIGGGN